MADSEQRCGALGCLRPITEDSPSLDFCSAKCQERWMRQQADMPPPPMGNQVRPVPPFNLREP